MDNNRGSWVSIHTLHELEASLGWTDPWESRPAFPFIRFTNWKQAEQRLQLENCGYGFHSYASRIGSKLGSHFRYLGSQVSIHTLHELEARSLSCDRLQLLRGCFHSYASRIGSKFLGSPRRVVKLKDVSIHTLHELEASWRKEGKRTPWIFGFHSYASRIGSKALQGVYCADSGWHCCFHSYASRIGSKTSFAKLGCTRIVQRFFVGYWKISHN